jgi:hypothetical protein
VPGHLPGAGAGRAYSARKPAVARLSSVCGASGTSSTAARGLSFSTAPQRPSACALQSQLATGTEPSLVPARIGLPVSAQGCVRSAASAGAISELRSAWIFS